MSVFKLSTLSVAFLSIGYYGAAAFSAPTAPDIKVFHSGQVAVAGAKTQPCDRDDCANRGEISVTLPVGATYVATHYLSNAYYKDDVAAPYDNNGVGSVAWGHFGEAVVTIDQNGQAVVTVYYYNRSNRNRVIALNVDYQM